MIRWMILCFQVLLILGATALPLTGLPDRIISSIASQRHEVLAGPLAQDDNDDDDNDDNDEDNGDNGDNGDNDDFFPTATPIPTETPIPSTTPLPTNTATNTPTPTVTLTPTPTPVCAPRPRVDVTASPDGSGRFQATITASGTNNRLQQLRFQASTNALIDVRNQTGAQGPFTVDLPDHPQQLTFVVRPANAGAAVTVPVIVVDGCGEWPTFVGQGR